MVSLGVVVPPDGGIEGLGDFARAAEAAGLDEVWLWEDCFADGGIVAATVALSATSRITVATGILPVPLRSVAVLAMEAAALARLFPGRLLLGVGHGVQDWMAQAGVRARSPLTLLREHVGALRGLLAGERLTVTGDHVNLDGVALDRPPAVPPPVWVGAEGAKTLELAGEIGEGVILTAGTSPERAAAAIARAEQGRRTSGRADAPPTSVYVMTVFATTAAAEAGHARLTRAAEAWGLEDGWTGVVGTPAEVAARLGDWIDAGVTRPVLVPLEDDEDAGYDAFLAGAAEVARLL